MKINEIKILFSEALRKNPKGVILICIKKKGDIEIQWSEVPLEVMCYAHHVMGMAIQNYIAQAVSGKNLETRNAH